MRFENTTNGPTHIYNTRSNLQQHPHTPKIQALLDVWPRDLHLFHPLSAPGAGGEQPPASPSEEGGAVPSPSSSAFAKALQAHFRSAVLHALMGEVRARLTEHGSGSGAPSPYLSTAAYKLTHNLPRFFGLVAANTFLARCVSWHGDGVRALFGTDARRLCWRLFGVFLMRLFGWCWLILLLYPTTTPTTTTT